MVRLLPLRGFIGVLVPLVVGPFAHAADVARGRSLAQIFAASAILSLQISRDGSTRHHSSQ
jgi:hypothetical protein